MSDGNDRPVLRLGPAPDAKSSAQKPPLTLRLTEPSSAHSAGAPPAASTQGQSPSDKSDQGAVDEVTNRNEPEPPSAFRASGPEGDDGPPVAAGRSDDDQVPPPKKPKRAKGEPYEVGHGKPPVEHQFKKGESGNDKGRRKGSISLKTELKRLVGEPVTVNENGKRTQHSTLRGLLMRVRADALSGKPRAIDQFIKLIIDQLPDETTHDHRQTAAEDAALLAAFKKRSK